MTVGAIAGAIIGFIIWALANKGHFERPNLWVKDRSMGPIRGIGTILVCAAIGAAIGYLLQRT